MMRNIFFGINLFCLVISLSGRSWAAGEVVAVIGQSPITLEEFNQKYNEIVKQAVNPPSKEIFLEDLVRYEMGLQEAKKKGLDKDPVVRDRMEQEMYKGLIEKEIGKKVADIKVSEKEMKDYYAKNPEIRTSNILIEFRANATDEQKDAARKRAEEIYDEVKKSKRPFEELVGLYSDDILSKRTQGDVGWQTRVTLVPTYYETALKMKIGEVKGLIPTQFGYHIIKVTGRHGYEDANKRQIRAAVFDQKRRVIFDDYFAKLKKQYPVKINKGVLK